MVKSKQEPADTSKVPDYGTNLLILGTIADTTWRMFTPVLTLLIAGMYVDGKRDGRPWYTLGGVLLGAVIAGLLVWQQYRTIESSDKKTKD